MATSPEDLALEFPLQLPERLKLLEKSTPEDQFLQPQELHLSPALAQARLLFQKLLPSPAPAPPLSLEVESLEELLLLTPREIGPAQLTETTLPEERLESASSYMEVQLVLSLNLPQEQEETF